MIQILKDFSATNFECPWIGDILLMLSFLIYTYCFFDSNNLKIEMSKSYCFFTLFPVFSHKQIETQL